MPDNKSSKNLILTHSKKSYYYKFLIKLADKLTNFGMADESALINSIISNAKAKNNKPYVVKEQTPDGEVSIAIYKGPNGKWPDRKATPDGYVYIYIDGKKVKPRPKNMTLTEYDWYVFHPAAPPS